MGDSGAEDSLCLVCYRPSQHRLHGRRPKRMTAEWTPGLLWYGTRPSLHGYFFHDYDPGERRKEQRRVE